MKPASITRSLLWPLAVAAVSAALIVAAVSFRSPATARDVAPTGAPPAPGGVVCFGTVDLEHGVTSLLPLQPGRVLEVLVRENQAVAKGAELLRLDDAAARSRLAEAEAALELSRLQLQQARTLPDQHRRRVARQQAVVEATGNRVAAARQILAQRQKLSEPALAAALQVFAAEVQVRELEALERAEEQRFAEIQAQDVEGDTRRAEPPLRAAEARRDQARMAVDECRVRAPASGTVLRILVGPGDVLGAERAQPALLFAADGPQVIRATVEQEFAPRIKEGDRATVQDEADSNASWRGRVERVAGWYSQRRVVLHDPSQLSDVRTLECVIVLEPGQPRLRLGQGVRIFIGSVSP